MFGLASVAHHREFLLKIMVQYPGHPIVQIPLLQNPDFLAELAKLVTMEGCSKVKPTGAPANVQQISLLWKVYTKLCTVIVGF